jgi:hypothetical protein
MAYISVLFYYLSVTCLVFVVIGLWRPWVMLWWEDVSNRRKVIKVYGLLSVFFYALYWGTKLF